MVINPESQGGNKMKTKVDEEKIPFRNRNHTGWWLAQYLIRFQGEDENENNLNRRCLAWKNTILIRANDRDEAFVKAKKIGKQCEISDSSQIRRGRKWVNAKWIFEGLTSLLPIYEEIEDGCEIMWDEYENITVKRVKSMTKKKRQLECFDDSPPQYMNE